VVPRTPRNRRVSRRNSTSSRSRRRSWIQRVARFPTVVGCAGWKWVYPRVGSSRCVRAKSASAPATGRSGPEEFQGLPVEDQVRVVADEGGGGPQVDDPPGGRGASPKRWTWAMTSWRNRRSYSAAAPGPGRPGAAHLLERLGGMSSPSSCWASARASQRRRQVPKRWAGEKMRCISGTRSARRGGGRSGHGMQSRSPAGMRGVGRGAAGRGRSGEAGRVGPGDAKGGGGAGRSGRHVSVP
jgi:hypothetical protein